MRDRGFTRVAGLLPREAQRLLTELQRLGGPAHREVGACQIDKNGAFARPARELARQRQSLLENVQPPTVLPQRRVSQRDVIQSGHFARAVP